MFDGQYGGYIFSCYAIVAIVTIGLTLWVVLDEKRQQKILDEFEARKQAARGSKAGK